jgi:hypothetical protein
MWDIVDIKIDVDAQLCFKDRQVLKEKESGERQHRERVREGERERERE